MLFCNICHFVMYAMFKVDTANLPTTILMLLKLSPIWQRSLLEYGLSHASTCQMTNQCVSMCVCVSACISVWVYAWRGNGVRVTQSAWLHSLVQLVERVGDPYRHLHPGLAGQLLNGCVPLFPKGFRVILVRETGDVPLLGGTQGMN